MRRKVLVAGVVFLFVALLAAVPGSAQDITGSIAGTVEDAQRKAVPGASVTLTNTDKNIVLRTVHTNDRGEYVAPLLPIGHYTVTVEAQGFKKYSQTGIMLNVNDKLTVNAMLEVGDILAAIVVEASAVQVELQSAAAAGLISGTQVRELALNSRNYEQLVSLMPGVSSTASDQIYIGTTNPSGQTNVVSFSINGNRNSANNWTIDGADNVDRGSNLTLLNYPSVDAIAEFKVLRNSYEAEFGRSASGQVNVVTKSGGSGFHGDLYEFFRNDVLAANNFFNNANNIARPPLRYNNFGGTIGGPIYIPGHYNTDKKKTFLFFSEEARRVITYGTVSATVPTTAEKSGTFPAPVCTAFNSNGTACTASSTQITNINPVAAAYIKDIFSKIPEPTTASTNSLVVPLRNIFNHHQELVRIDQVFGPKLMLSGRYLRDTIPTEEPGGLFTGAALLGVSTTDTNSPGHSWAIRYTATFSPTVLGDGGYSFSYGAIISRPIGLDASSNSPDIQVPLPFPSTLPRVPSLSFSGFTTAPGIASVAGFGPYNDFNRDHNIFDNLTKIWGRQTLKFGFSYHYYQKTENAAGNNVGTFTFSNTPRPTGTSLYQQDWANFLLGNVSSFTQASVDLTPDIRAHHAEFYAQDDVRVRSNLTLSWGLRFSRFTQPTDRSHSLTNFDPQLWDPSKAPQVNPKSGNIILGTGDPLNGIIIAGQNSPFGKKVANENSNFGPRFGLAWDPFKSGKTSVRAGFGIFFDAMLFGITEQNIFSNPPFVQNITISNTRLDNPAAGTPSISAAPKTLRATPLPAHTPYVQEWSLGIQRELMKNLLVDVGYVGNKGTHLIGIVDINEVPPGAAIAQGLVPPGTVFTSANTPILNTIRPFRGYGPINTIESRFNSNYHSLQVGVQKRFAGESLLNISYTYSKALTDNGSDRSNAVQNSYDIQSEYGPSPLDRTHILTANYVYELPWMKEQRGLAGHILGGWEVSGIVTYESGVPLTVTSSGTDPGGLGILGPSAASPRPDLVGNPNSGAPHTTQQWFNIAAFAAVPAGQARPGNSGRGVVRGPGIERWDFSAFKNIRIREAMRLQFRGELFNIFNYTNFDTLRLTFGPTNFGQVATVRDPRILQLAMKFYF